MIDHKNNFGTTDFGVPQPRTASEFDCIMKSAKPVIRGVDFSNFKERYMRSNIAIAEQEEDKRSECNTIDPNLDLENKIIQIIRQKEEVLKASKSAVSTSEIENQVKAQQRSVNTSRKNLLKVAACLKMYFATRNVRNVFLAAAVDYIFKSAQHQNVGGRSDIEEAITELLSLDQGWIRQKKDKESGTTIIQLVDKEKFNRILNSGD